MYRFWSQIEYGIIGHAKSRVGHGMHEPIIEGEISVFGPNGVRVLGKWSVHPTQFFWVYHPGFSTNQLLTRLDFVKDIF